MASIDISKEVVNYRNRFLREVIFDLVVRFGKDGIMHILRDIKTDETPKDDVFISTEEDGSEWVHLEDYNNLRMAFLINELSLEKQIIKNSDLLQEQKYIHKTILNACREHYWDSMEDNKTIIMDHIEGVLEFCESRRTPRAADGAKSPAECKHGNYGACADCAIESMPPRR